MKNILLSILLAAPICSYAAQDNKALMREFDSLNSVCMSDDASKASISAACDKRDSIYEKISASGMCFMTYNLPMEQRRWRPCKSKVLVMVMAGNKAFKTGDTVPPANAVYHLFVEQPCQLPIADKRNVFSFTQSIGRNARHGCWYPAVSGGFVIMFGSGEIDSQPSLTALPRATLNPDGSATITEPNYDSNTFTKTQLEKASAEQRDAYRRGDY